MKKILFIHILFIFYSCTNPSQSDVVKLQGNALGTTFHITYISSNHKDFSYSVDSIFENINKSMSTYISTSDISRINNGDASVAVDHNFQEVFKKSMRIYKETNGVFDPTIGILVNAWGFGPKKSLKNIDSLKVHKLLKLVGLNKVKIINNKVIKTNPKIFLDYNAIAKGYTVDVIGRFLESQNIKNYLVEIGGEIRTRGLNGNHKKWKIAIEKPNFDGSRSFQEIIELENEAIATSGSYRKYKIDTITGKKYAHTIDTKTGYPSKSNLLSTSVITKEDCADADGYATALMAFGFEKSKLFLNKHPELQAFLIYVDKHGNLKTYTSPNSKFKVDH